MYSKGYTETEPDFNWRKFYKSFCPISLVTKDGIEAREVTGFAQSCIKLGDCREGIGTQVTPSTTYQREKHKMRNDRGREEGPGRGTGC